jgi:hypothetical protein
MSLIVTPETVADHLERLVGSPLALREQIEGYVRASLGEAQITARSGAALLRRVRDKELWRPSGWRSWRSFCAFFAPEEPERIDVLIRALEVLESRGEKRDFGEAEAQRLAGHGGDRRSARAKADQVDIINLKQKGGTDPTYLEARLEKLAHEGMPRKGIPPIAEAAELLRRVRAKEMSAHAAKAMGWRKRKRDPDPFDELCKWWDRADDADRARFEAGIVGPSTRVERMCRDWREATEDERAAVIARHADELRRMLELAPQAPPAPRGEPPARVGAPTRPKSPSRAATAPDASPRSAALVAMNRTMSGEEDETDAA